MQYDIDMHGSYAEVLQYIRDILLSYPQIQEIRNPKQTSYRDRHGMIIMLRAREDRFVVAFGRGAKLQERFPLLQGSGKVVRHLYYQSIDEVDEVQLREMIEESFVLGMEAEEIKMLRASWKQSRQV